LNYIDEALSRAVFLDRDGTIVKEIPPIEEEDTFGYLTSAEEIKIIEGSAKAIALAKKLGFKVIIVTNQSAISRGLLTDEGLKLIHKEMIKKLEQEDPGAVIDHIYYSPYHIDGVIEKYRKESLSRKPEIGMIMEAKERYNIDIKSSYMIGDSITDMKCGVNAGLKNILVLTGYGKIAKQKCLDVSIKIDFIADNLLEAVKFIEKNEL
jgi:D-glycero-D-manno-heptose 1,7-bisphosphate phosphatase